MRIQSDNQWGICNRMLIFRKVCRDVLWKSINILFRSRKFHPIYIPKVARGCLCAPLRLSFRGSMTVEASLITPIFFLSFFSLLYVLQILFGLQQTQGEIRNAAREYACYGTKVGTVKMLLKENKVLCWEEKERYCYVDYHVRIPVLGNLFSPFHLYQQMEINPYEGVSMIPEEETTDDYVYITQTGRVWHRRRDCAYLNPSIQKVSVGLLETKRNASGGKYYGCERCCKGKDADDYAEVFITSYGESFHSRKTCSGLKRTIRKVKRSETGLAGCSRCS